MNNETLKMVSKTQINWKAFLGGFALIGTLMLTPILKSNEFDSKSPVYVVDTYGNHIDTLPSIFSQFRYGYPEDKSKLKGYQIKYEDGKSIIKFGGKDIKTFEGEISFTQK